MNMTTKLSTVISAAAATAMVLAIPTAAQAQYRQTISNNPAKCQSGGGKPAVWITINNVSASRGTLRVQSYRGTSADWLKKGRWLSRIELPARAGQMNVCMPVPEAGTYAIAIRHDLNGNGDTDLREDGGGMSNNPSINIFNLGKPSHTKTAFSVGNGVKSITINMRYW